MDPAETVAELEAVEEGEEVCPPDEEVEEVCPPDEEVLEEVDEDSGLRANPTTRQSHICIVKTPQNLPIRLPSISKTT